MNIISEINHITKSHCCVYYWRSTIALGKLKPESAFLCRRRGNGWQTAHLHATHRAVRGYGEQTVRPGLRPVPVMNSVVFLVLKMRRRKNVGGKYLLEMRRLNKAMCVRRMRKTRRVRKTHPVVFPSDDIFSSQHIYNFPADELQQVSDVQPGNSDSCSFIPLFSSSSEVPLWLFPVFCQAVATRRINHWQPRDRDRVRRQFVVSETMNFSLLFWCHKKEKYTKANTVIQNKYMCITKS